MVNWEAVSAGIAAFGLLVAGQSWLVRAIVRSEMAKMMIGLDSKYVSDEYCHERRAACQAGVLVRLRHLEGAPLNGPDAAREASA